MALHRIALWLATIAIVPGADGPLTLLGRVVEKDTSTPVAGATVVVALSLVGVPAGAKLPDWVGESALRTGADGRFTIAFSAEQVAEPRLYIGLARVVHPEFVARQSRPVPLASLVQGRTYGDVPFFDTVVLERGVEYSGQVVTPEGRPLADVAYDFQTWSSSNSSRDFWDNCRGRSDAEGWFRLRMPATRSLQLDLTPEAYAPWQHFWKMDEPARNPDARVATDLGRIVLERGTTLSGRVLDLEGKPIAGQTVVAVGRQNRARRSATSSADGTFAITALRPGNYDVWGDRQDHGPYFDPTEPPPLPSPPRVLRPAWVFFRPREAPAPIELRETESVRVAVRFVDAQGRPVPRGLASLSGTLPNPQGKVAGAAAQEKVGASGINKQEEPAGAAELFWGCQLTPDEEGRIVFRAPKGLRNAVLASFPPDETVAFKTRLGPGKPLKHWGGGLLGDLDADRAGIAIIVYRAPVVLATVETEDGEQPFGEVSVHVNFSIHGAGYGGNVQRQADGRFRTLSLMPDHEYQCFATADGYVPNLVRRVNVPEGSTTEVTLHLKMPPMPLHEGDPAPPFTAKTRDGRTLGLADYRGKVLLLHFWDPLFGQGAAEVPHVQTVDRRFGKDDRLAILGLCLVDDPEDGAKAIQEHGLDWPQAILRDRGLDPMALDYGARRSPKTVLIGPDGRILAADLKGAPIVEAVAKVLGE
jgi:peroxiredoxin